MGHLLSDHFNGIKGLFVLLSLFKNGFQYLLVTSWLSLAMKNKFLPFFLFLSHPFFLQVYFNFLSVLSVLTLQENKYCLPFSNNKLSNTDPRRMEQWLQFVNELILLFQMSANSQDCTSREPLLFLALCLALESLCGARHSTCISISIVIKLAWLRSPYCCDNSTTVVGDSTLAIPLAMLTLKNKTLGSHNLYAWFLSVSPISIGVGLCSSALWASKAPL